MYHHLVDSPNVNDSYRQTVIIFDREHIVKRSYSRRPGYIYLFGGNKDGNSTDSLKILGKVRMFRAARSNLSDK